MKLALFSVFTVGLYWVLVWGAMSNPNTQPIGIKHFIVVSMLVFSVLVGSFYLSLFWCLFVAFLVFVTSLYIGHAKAETYGPFLRNSTIGGIWLSIPIYVYLAI